MRSFSFISVITTLSLTLLLVAGCSAQANTANDDDQIVVSGQGTVHVVPDTMRFSLWVEADGHQLSPIKTQVDQITAAILNQLQQRDIKREDMRSFQLAIHPKYKREGDQTVQDGFQVSRQIDVTLRDASNFDHLIDYALAQGVTRVGSIQYQLGDASEASQQALLRAIDDAHTKAALIAEHSDRELGSIITIRESSSNGAPIMRMAAESRTMDVSEPGQQAINAQVEVVFRLR
ncbi:SIMPL domain-containing protein [Aliidiomarina soli]|uniref:SIMPL domain-containing protein n=1 Tax=Aliidiomarina soli TaxID=1928574 RepID=A0A432WH47_9GAMM|nr:SIMPL domain-containing protein [Aliidiomarina soli]RUO33075.1 hypothetical protein CWE14_07525 [Aliidiomarina soli]